MHAHPTLASLDKALWLAHLIKKDRAFLLTYPEYQPSLEQCRQYHEGCYARLQGKPLAYLTQEAGFLGEMYYVDERVLVPRPETESLVLYLLSVLEDRPLTMVDVGTGSGVIALALKKARPSWDITAVDCEQGALDVMLINARRLGLSLTAICQDGLQALHGLDCVVSNPPYIAPDDPCLLGDGLPFEPQTALVADDHGYRILHQVAREAFLALKPQGLLAIEHGETQDLQSLLHDLGYVSIEKHYDLMGKHRFTTAVKP